jgi:AhpD family alkylhydroperoxidase
MKTFAESSDKKFITDILNGASLQSKAWLAFDHSVGDTETLIPFKYKELMAIAIALTTQCPYCLEKHTKKAREHGATQEEIAETIMIAAALRSGAALGYGLLAMKLFKEDTV